MANDEGDRPRKTLGIRRAPRAGDGPSPDAAPERRRSGARAKAVSQQQRVQDRDARIDARREAERQPEPAPPVPGSGARSERRGAPPRPRQPAGERAAGVDMPHAEPRRRLPRARAPEVFRVFTPCPAGLEHALATELRALGFEDAEAARAGCRLSTDWIGVQRLNLHSRLATRVLVQVAHAPVRNEDDLLELARATAWERWFGAEHTLRVDTSAIKSPMRSLQFCNLRVKDGICDRLMDREGARPSIDTVRPHARVHAFLDQDSATLYLDTSGESLFKRGWRLDKGEAPLRENLAAGMLALARWDPTAALLDPFCGSGTILIEAALIALGVPPGITRPFAFERMRGHDARLWHDIKEDAHAHILPHIDTLLVGSDLDEQAIGHARQNAARAGLTEGTIRFETADARALRAPAPQGWIVTNPPYGERMGSAEDELWREWATTLKRNFAGWQVHVISSDMQLAQHMRLKPMRRTPLYNGALECRLFAFELVGAGYRDRHGADEPGHGAERDDDDAQDSATPA